MERFFRFFNIREGERSRAILLFAYQFLVVAILVQGRIIRDTLFLKRFDVRFLPLMYICYAIVVPLLTFIYTKKSGYFRLDTLIKGVLSLSGISTLALILLIKMGWVMSYPLLYIFVDIMGAFIMFQFWSFTNDMFDSREAKRVFGFLGTGGVLASFVAGIGIKKLVAFISIENILFINILFMGACYLIVSSMGKKYRSRLQRGLLVKSGVSVRKRRLGRVFSSPYVKQIAIITSFIFIIVTVVDYQFKIAAKDYFNETELAVFFGAIYAIFGGGLSFIFQSLLTSRLLKVGIFLSLSILPAMITGFSTFFLFYPVIWLITLAKASDSTFRYTINDSAMQLLYIPLHRSVRREAKAVVDGIVKPFFTGLAGLGIFFLKSSAFNGRILTLAVVLLGIAWLAAIFVIRREYLSVLMETIKKKRFGGDDLEIKKDMVESIVGEAINSRNEDELLMALDMIERRGLIHMGKYFVPILNVPSIRVKKRILSILRRMESRIYSYDIMKLTRDEDNEVVREAILTYGHTMMERSIKYISSFLDHDDLRVRSAVVVALIRYCGINGIMVAAPHLKALVESEKTEERSTAAYILGEIGQKNLEQQLFALLNDAEAPIRREAIRAARKIGSSAFIPTLFYKLLDRETGLDALNSLASYGEKVLNPASDILRNNIDTQDLKIKVVRMLGYLHTRESAELLLETLDSKSEGIRNAVLKSLRKIVSAKSELTLDMELLKKYLFKEFYHFFQMHYFYGKISRKLDVPYLRDVIEEKKNSSFERLFSILGLMYGIEVFDTIHFYVTQEHVSKEQKSNAIEIIDNLVEKDIRKILVPLIETEDRRDILKLGFQSFKIEVMGFEKILESFLIDGSEWVRAATLHLVARANIINLASRIRIFLYDPSPIVRESALFASFNMGLKIAEDDLLSLKGDESPIVSDYAGFIENRIAEERKFDADYS